MVINSSKRVKFFSWHNLFATAVVFGVIKFLPIIFTIDFLDPIQNTIQDFNAADIVFSQMRDYNKIEKDTNIVLVNIGTLNRQGIADLINIINAYEPKVIGIDSFFRKPKSGNQDSALAQALSEVKNLVLVSEAIHLDDDFKFDTMLYSNEMFSKYAHNSYANIITDDKSGFRVVRSISPREYVNDSLCLFFAVEVAKQVAPDKVRKFLERDNEFEYVNFKRNIYSGKFTALDCDYVIQNKEKLSFIKNKIVLMGFLGPDIETLVFEDIFFTPMNKHYLGKAIPDMYGVVIHANTITMILDEDYLGSTSSWLKLFITFLIIYLNMALFYYISIRFEDAYEMANLFITMFELFFLFTIMIYVFYWFNFDIGLREATVFGILFSATGFELYHGSFKPIVKNFATKITKRKMKKASEKFVGDFKAGKEESAEL
ncbi:MAG: CHASE2 domain-containing protein [bacterium]